MARQAVDQHPSEQIDHDLEYQWKAWADVPWRADTWPEMDGTEREVFHLEWVGITEARLRTLQSWADQGLLTTEQQRRFVELTQLVAEQRPTLQTLLADDAAPLPQAPARNV